MTTAQDDRIEAAERAVEAALAALAAIRETPPANQAHEEPPAPRREGAGLTAADGRDEALRRRGKTASGAVEAETEAQRTARHKRDDRKEADLDAAAGSDRSAEIEEARTEARRRAARR
jgi:hypothetical protein